MDYTSAFGAEFREVQDRTRDGKPVRAVIATRSYATDCGDLWEALTDAEQELVEKTTRRRNGVHAVRDIARDADAHVEAPDAFKRGEELLSRADNNGERISITEFERAGDVHFCDGLEFAIDG